MYYGLMIMQRRQTSSAVVRLCCSMMHRSLLLYNCFISTFFVNYHDGIQGPSIVRMSAPLFMLWVMLQVVKLHSGREPRKQETSVLQAT
jgi:hypothetical protein